MHTEATTPKRKKEEANDEKNKKVKNTESNTSIPSTPTSAAKKAGPKTPREKFDLPEGFTVEEKKTDKKSWKEYRGPDGKNIEYFSKILINKVSGKKFRSLAEIHRSLSGITKDSSSKSKSEESNNLDQQSIEDISKYVENSWKIAEDGGITKCKNKWYKSEGLGVFPKKALYFTVENPKSVDQSKSPKKKKQQKEKED